MGDADWQSKYDSATAIHHPWAGNGHFREYCVVGLGSIRGPVKLIGDVKPGTHAVYIRNVGQPSFLDSHGDEVWVWGDGHNIGPVPRNLEWVFEPVPGEPDTFFIIHKRFNKFLDSHGRTVSLWGDGRDVGS